MLYSWCCSEQLLEQVALRILKQCCVAGVPNSEFGTQLLICRSCSNICLFRIMSGTLCCLFQNCINAYCPLCQLDSKVLQVKVRGLCSQSIFNSVYTVTLSDTGNIYYLGDKTSSIKFDKIQQNWQWLDQKNNRSIAIRQGNKIMKYCQLENKLLGSTSKESFKIIILSSLKGELS